MGSMETFIILIALAAAAGGGLILLVCLAGMRAHLVKAFNLQQELETRKVNTKDEGMTDPDSPPIAKPLMGSS